MRCKLSNEIKTSDITDEALFWDRRRFIQSMGLASIALAISKQTSGAEEIIKPDFQNIQASPFSSKEALTSFNHVTHYNNFYEFGTDKGDPERHAHLLQTRPWSVLIDGALHKPQSFDIDELLKFAALEERIYRLRCVEGWSMVIPWLGFPLASLLKRVEPLGQAKFVEFTTLHDPKQMPGQASNNLSWPYTEGLRLDEAMHPLTLLAVGLYGKRLPNQNGAPIRLVVPWKYGFKSIKSIVRIRFSEQQPKASWMRAVPGEYGFYANVNPNVDHPRWSQAKERRIGEYFKRPSLMFNGYADQVASLYSGMDLQQNF